MAKDKSIHVRTSLDMHNQILKLLESGETVGEFIRESILKNIKNRGDKNMNNLYVTYKEWVKDCKEMLENGFGGSLDCGEKAVREDFSRYAELKTEISFKDMLELENRYLSE